MTRAFSQKEIFPIIGKVVDDELSKKDSVSRDEIVEKLLSLKDPEKQKIISAAIKKSKRKDPVHNMVDWFSAEITKVEKNTGGETALRWKNKYFRPRIKIKGQSKILEYRKKETLDKDTLEKKFEKDVQNSLHSNIKSRQKRLADNKDDIPKRVEVISNVFRRNPDVVAAVLERANGVCENCKQNAPFLRAIDDMPYLEVHHKIRLVDGGRDNVKNAIALCPNCHREAHFGKLKTHYNS